MSNAGRPTDYRPEYGDIIVDLMSAGFSLAAAASTLDVHRQRVYEWCERHPEFADAVNKGRVKRQMFLENRLLTADSSPHVTSTIFALKNAAPDDWREKVVNEHTGKDGGPIETKKELDMSKLTEEELAALAVLVAASERDKGGD